jgi:hypothetical protein
MDMDIDIDMDWVDVTDPDAELGGVTSIPVIPGRVRLFGGANSVTGTPSPIMCFLFFGNSLFPNVVGHFL